MGLFSNTTPDILKGVQAVVNVVSVLNGVGTRTDTEKILQADPLNNMKRQASLAFNVLTHP